MELGLCMASAARLNAAADPVDDPPGDEDMKAVLWLGIGFALLVGCSRGDDAGVTVSTPSADGGPAAASQGIETPTSEPGVLADETPEITRYIGLTGGVGVSLRDRCDDSARLGGSLPEGTLVHVLEADAESCLDWSFVVAGDQETWVRNRYLASDPPARGVSAPAPSSGTTAQPSTTPTLAPRSSGEPMFLSGSTKANTVVYVYVGGRPCRQAIVQPATGFWAADVSPSDGCGPTAGEVITFTVNGSGVRTASTHRWSSGGSAFVVFRN